ncbi:MAG: hypothetical protein CEE38_21640 [Planctomycetes bacterium B3_Pla]|nr:MAG: hypothetical protein CEE38_21640 [Planctomycetes bacterium B3_Pla]
MLKNARNLLVVIFFLSTTVSLAVLWISFDQCTFLSLQRSRNDLLIHVDKSFSLFLHKEPRPVVVVRVEALLQKTVEILKKCFD